MIRNADWILDLGPEGGEDGGRIVGEGRPAKIAKTPGSFTGEFLARYYASHNGKLEEITSDEVSTRTVRSCGMAGHSERPNGSRRIMQLPFGDFISAIQLRRKCKRRNGQQENPPARNRCAHEHIPRTIAERARGFTRRRRRRTAFHRSSRNRKHSGTTRRMDRRARRAQPVSRTRQRPPVYRCASHRPKSFSMIRHLTSNHRRPLSAKSAFRISATSHYWPCSSFSA